MSTKLQTRHASKWVGDMHKLLARKRMTTAEIAESLDVSEYAADMWVKAMEEDGIYDSRVRVGDDAMSASFAREYWLCQSWGGDVR